MAFTKHGHHIANSPADQLEVGSVARCGGPSLCVSCARDASAWYVDNNPKKADYKPADIMQYFKSKHLPSALAAVAMPFEELATMVDEHVPNGPEKSVALRKLLEGKDAAVRASLDLV